MTNLYHHELLDRLYIIMDMYNSYICEHNSDDILPKEEKEKVRSILWEQYQYVGSNIVKEEENEKV